jgi:hypothetical protein
MLTGRGFAAPLPAGGGIPQSSVSLLTDVCRLTRQVRPSEVARWKQILHHPARLSAARAARLHLWLGEVEIARNKEPERAIEQFQQAMRLTRPHDLVYGCAAYDRAFTLYMHGAYALSAQGFQALLRSRSALAGYNLQSCALMFRHAAACAGYHAERAKLGIAEPTSLDPLCGVASLAACLQAHGKPCDKKTLLSHCRVMGLGSSMRDLLEGAKRLGMSAVSVKADAEGLKALPKPLVAYVEQDHFVAVTRADKEGVSYLCSDCGAWPGGRRDLSWKQWRAMDCNVYLAVTRPGSPEAHALQALNPPSRTVTASRLSARGSLVYGDGQGAHPNISPLRARVARQRQGWIQTKTPPSLQGRARRSRRWG